MFLYFNLIKIFLIFILLFNFNYSFQCSSFLYSNINIIKPFYSSLSSSSSSSSTSSTASSSNVCSNITIKIGAPLSIYYKDIFYLESIQMLNGWKMFIEYINYEKKGIILNNITYFIEFIYIEDYSQSKTVQEITNYLINDYNVDFIFGPFSTPLTAVSASITDPNNVTLISSGAPLPGVFEQTKYAYGLLPAASTYSEGAFSAFHNLGAKNISVISDTEVSVCNNISSNIYATKYNMKLFKHYDVNITDPNFNETMKNILNELKENKVETVFGCSFSSLCEKV